VLKCLRFIKEDYGRQRWLDLFKEREESSLRKVHKIKADL